jgi:putative transposase
VPNYRRYYQPGASYFFTVVTHRRQRFLLDEPIRAALRQAIQETRQTWPFNVEAWVMLPDHLHCIWTLPKDDPNFSIRWSLIKGGVSRRCQEYQNPELLSRSKAARRESSLWQRRFWEHQLRDEDDFAKHLDYIHYNPVKHGYVRRARDWQYSTFQRWVSLGLYEPDWGDGLVMEGDFGELAE